MSVRGFGKRAARRKIMKLWMRSRVLFQFFSTKFNPIIEQERLPSAVRNNPFVLLSFSPCDSKALQ